MIQRTLPARLYGDPDAYVRERTGVFARAWLLIGHEAEATEPGDWIAANIAGHRLFVVRGKDGVLRAFHNVCRHRAGPLVQGERGHCPGELTCAYHGWRYALDGRLRSAVGFGPAEGFDPRDFSLFGLKLEIWRGLVFVSLNEAPPDFAAFIAPLERLMDQHGLAVPGPAQRRSHRIDCDWKVYVENYLESYHIASVHPALTQELGCDYQVSVQGDLVIQQSASQGDGPQAGLWGWLWPNLAINIYRDGAMIERMVPDGPGRTRLDYLFLRDDDPEPLADALAASDQLTAEDAAICEAVQANLSAGAYDIGILSPTHEAGVAWFQSRISEVHR